jgi:hypothetical protein
MGGMNVDSINTGGINTGGGQPATIRASDAERERYAAIIGTATGDGRLTTAEADERLAAIYAARFRHELDPLIADLPGVEQEKARPATARTEGKPLNWQRGPLAVHLGIVVVICTVIVIRWITMGADSFLPIIPMLWLGASLLIHARIRRTRPGSRSPVRPSAN